MRKKIRSIFFLCVCSTVCSVYILYLVYLLVLLDLHRREIDDEDKTHMALLLTVMILASSSSVVRAAAINAAAEAPTTTTATSTATAMRGGRTIRHLQPTSPDQDDDPLLPLYEYNLLLDTSTPLSSQYDQCTGWPDYSDPANFTWYALRMQLPVDIVAQGGQWMSAIASMNMADGYVQPYSETVPVNLYNYTFTSSHADPVVKMNLNSDLMWDSYQFDFTDRDDTSDGASVAPVVTAVSNGR